MWRKSRRLAGGDGIIKAPANHPGVKRWRRGQQPLSRRSSGVNGTGALPLLALNGLYSKPEVLIKIMSRGTAASVGMNCTKNATASYPLHHPSTPCPSCPLARPSQCRKENLCQWARCFSSCGCLTPRLPMTPANLQKYRETAVPEHEIGFSNIQCIPSTLAANLLPKDFSLFSQKKKSLVLFLNLLMLQLKFYQENIFLFTFLRE